MNHVEELEDYIQRNSDDAYDPDEPGNVTPPRRVPVIKKPRKCGKRVVPFQKERSSE
jgi:hypothetical protein